MENVRKGIKIAGDVGDHPDENYNPNALPVMQHIRIKNVWGEKVQQAGLIKGLKNSPFTDVCLANIHLAGSSASRNGPWTCSDVHGGAVQVSPSPCVELISGSQASVCSIPF